MNRKQLIWYALLGVVLLVPLTSFVSVRILVLTLVASLFSILRNRIEMALTAVRFIDILFYILVLGCGLFYSQNIKDGLKVLETSFAFLAMTVVFFAIGSVDEKKVRQVYELFSFGLFVASSICLVNSLIQYMETGNDHVFFSYELTEIIKSHPTYLAYYLIFAITMGLYFLNYGKNQSHPLLKCSLILFFFLVLQLTGGQTTFISLLLVFSFFILKFFLGDRSRNEKLTFGLVTIMMTSMFFVSTTQHSYRENNLNDSWDRFELWKAAIKANPDVLFGVGTGDSNYILNLYFREHGLNEYADENLNGHNQFIQTYLSNGIVGLLALLFMLSRPLYLAFKNNDALGILVFFPFLIYGMTEVFLGRYQGVVFFALLHQVFVSYYTSSRPPFSLKEG